MSRGPLCASFDPLVSHFFRHNSAFALHWPWISINSQFEWSMVPIFLLTVSCAGSAPKVVAASGSTPGQQHRQAYGSIQILGSTVRSVSIASTVKMTRLADPGNSIRAEAGWSVESAN